MQKGKQVRHGVDEAGDAVREVTEFTLQDYRHTCRTCKEMDSVTNIAKLKKYNPADLRRTQKTDTKLTPNRKQNFTESQLKAFDSSRLIKIILHL